MRVIFTVLYCILYFTAVGQFKPLFVGEKIPNITINGFTVNGELLQPFNKQFSDFQGKLVILDFWSTWCGSCIDGFPKMSELQTRYGDKVQVILVNTNQDKDFVSKWIKDNSRTGKSIVPRNLPVIAGADVLGKLFPKRAGVPYHVWIGKDGKVVLRGIYENTNKKKIDQYLSGKAVTYVEDNGLVYNVNEPFFKLYNDKISKLQTYSSAFCPFTDKYADPYGTSVTNRIDSVKKTRRNTWLNVSAEALFNKAYADILSLDSFVLYGSRLIINAENDTIYREPYYIKNATDETYRNSGHCYEQIVPIEMSEASRLELMREELTRYFMVNHNVSVTLKEIEVPCFTIGLITKKVSKYKEGRMAATKNENGQSVYVYEHSRLQDVFKHYLGDAKTTFISDEFVVGSDDINAPIDIKLPFLSTFNDIDEFSKYLAAQGISFNKTFKKVKMLVLDQNGTYAF